LKEACGTPVGMPSPTPSPTPLAVFNNMCCLYTYYDNPNSRACICAINVCPVLDGFKIISNIKLIFHINFN
jgi:hypothetical protein